MTSHEKGVAGEDFVNEIAFKSFMKFWCYPGAKDEDGDNKEICDLLVLFGTSVLIISVKNYEFKNNYDRYFKRTIGKAVNQVYGAERKLFGGAKHVWIKHPDRPRERVDSSSYEKVYRIIVNLGEGVKLYAPHLDTKGKGFIHIFDKSSYQTIVGELDTLPDFLEYLDKRQLLLEGKNAIILPGEESDFFLDDGSEFVKRIILSLDRSPKQQLVISGTEHDLLAHYLQDEREFPKEATSAGFSMSMLDIDGAWKALSKSSKARGKKELDKVSYFIDNLVENEVLRDERTESIHLAKMLLSFSRFDRRVISKNFHDLYAKYYLTSTSLARSYTDIEGRGIVLMYYSAGMPADVVDKIIQLTMDSLSVYYQYRSSSMITIATALNFSGIKIGMMRDIKPYPKDLETEIMQNAKSMNWFTNLREIRVREYDYPDIDK